MNQNTIALFGGTFDPPHRGHLQMAQRVIEDSLAGEVIFVPAARSPHKTEKVMQTAQHRYAMVESLIDGQENISISDYEIINNRQFSYTFYTLKVLQAAYPNKRIKLIIGVDNLPNFNTWYKSQEILDNFELIIFQRETEQTINFLQLRELFGRRLAKKMQEDMVVFDCDISSTDFRQAFQQQKDCNSLVTPQVLKYITDNKLYG